MAQRAKIIELTFVRKEVIQSGYYGFYFSTDEKFDFNPGQYVQMNLPHAHPDELGTSRYFSISSAPHEEYLLITTRLPQQGEIMSSFKKALVAIEIGSKVNIMGPMGKFVLQEN